MKRALAIALLIILPTTCLHAGSTIVGAGSQSCTSWMNRRKNPVVKAAFESWVVGFVSGLNVSAVKDIIGGGDFTAIVAWMDRRCMSHPMDQIGIAALDLAMELASQTSNR